MNWSSDSYDFLHVIQSDEAALFLSRNLEVECLLKFLGLEEFLRLAFTLVEHVGDVLQVSEGGLEGGPVMVMMRGVLQ